MSTDELYDLTADEVDEPAWMSFEIPPVPPPAITLSPAVPAQSPVRFALWVTLLVVWATLVAAFALTAAHTFDNWFYGRGFTPVMHVQSVREITPASVTWTIGEAAQR